MWRYWRVLGLLLLAANLASLLAVAVARNSITVLAPDGWRCQFIFEPTPLQMKFLFQFLNHVAQSCFFVW
jgi:hypothetical protein